MKELFKNLKINIRNVLAMVCIIGVFVLLLVLMYHPIPEGNRETVQRALDQILVVGFAVVISYFFVASKNDTDRQNHEQTKEVVETK